MARQHDEAVSSASSDLRDFTSRFGADTGRSTSTHARPVGLNDATVEALGRLSAALETAEDARGHLYAFHRLSGRADLDLQDAVEALRAAGHQELADAIDTVMTGRNVIADRWTFELVEDYDANYMTPFRAAEQVARGQFDAPPHLAEAEMKAREQDRG